MKSETEENQVDRQPTYSHVHLERKANNRVKIWKSLKTKLKNKCTCNTRKAKKVITGFLPVIRWLPKYNFKENTWGDIMSGLIIGIILVPQAIAYSLLAGLKPIYSLYTSFFANLIYFIMGTSRHVSVGIFSLLSLMVGQVVDREVQLAGFDLDDDVMKNIKDGNATDLMMNITMVNFTIGPLNIECGKECYAISVAAALTFLAGIYQKLFNRMIHEEREMKDRIEKNIQFCRKELKALCHDLSVEYKIDENMTILQIERDLRVRLEALSKQKTDRLEELKILQQKDQELCSDLCVTPYYIPSGSIPSLDQLEELKKHIKVQTEEKRKRLQAFSALRTEIRQCLDEIGRQPENSLEQDAICEDEEAFFLTPENIKALTVLKTQLELRKEALLSTLNTVKERVLSLWDLLQVTQEEREACEKISGRSISEELKMWESELARLEELKMVNLKQVILNIRKELKDYWDKCFYTLEQTKAFAPYYCEDFTEALLSQHDEEIIKMRVLYEKCKLILDAVAKWESNWAQFVILEKKALDPSRFSNRGGTLLKEEKERAKLQKLITKLEEELKSKIDLWEIEQGCPFLIKGIKFMDYVANQWEMLKQQKEREKQDRTQKKEETTPFKTPIKRPAAACTQGTPSNKTRKLNGTTNSTMSRTPNVTHSSVNQSAGKVPLATIKTPLKTRDTPVRTPLQDSNKQSVAFSSQPGSYSEFKEEISKKSSKDTIFNSTIKEHL